MRFLMKTFFSFAYRENAITRFGCSIMSIAGLTFVVFPTQARQPQQRVHIGIQITGGACSDNCFAKFNNCMVAKTEKNICYYNYNVCLTNCGTGSGYSYLEPRCFLPKQS
jgi:hypothetical protein